MAPRLEEISVPKTVDDLRNISCSALVSKVYESYVLDWLLKEVSVKKNQFGGVKGRSVEHLLCSAWNEICQNLEDQRAGTLLTCIDYAKGFNRLSYQHCLAALKRAGASQPVLELVATFLTNRAMELKVDGKWSEPKKITGGVPQGSILGVILFNLTTDDLDAGGLLRDGDPVSGEDSGTLQEEGAEEPLSDEEHEPQPLEGPNTASTPKGPTRPEAMASPVFATPIGKDLQVDMSLEEGLGRRFTINRRCRNISKRRLFQPKIVPEEPSTKKRAGNGQRKSLAA